jgi:polysaccharide biosynthesis/export protein
MHLLHLKTFLYLLLFFAITGSSCLSSKKVVYFQGLDTSKTNLLVPAGPRVISKQDILEIAVTSLSKDDYVHFTNSGFQITPDQTVRNSYLPDSTGVIDLPYIGTIKVVDMTTTELTAVLKNKLQPYLKEPVVNIRIMNMRISILGEVAKPGTYEVPQGNINFLQALGMAGDLTVTAKRNDILLIREQKGQRTYTKINLTKPSLLSSDYYQLLPNDVIYVQPGKSKIAQADTKFWQIVTFITTALSLTIILISRL